MKARALANNQKIDLAVSTADSINMTALFSLFLNDVLTRFLEETGRFFMFPLAAMGGAIRAVLAWRQTNLDNGKNGSLVRAIVETVGALAITTAVVGGFVAASIFASISPLIFTATLTAKTLFHTGSAFYYWGKSVAASTPEKKLEYKEMSRANAVGAIALTLSTVAVGFVMLAAKPIFAVLGILAGVIGTSYSIYNLAKTSIPSRPSKGYTLLADDNQSTETQEKQTKKTLSPSALIHQKLQTESRNKSLSNNVNDRQVMTNKSIKETRFFSHPNPLVKREEGKEEGIERIFSKSL